MADASDAGAGAGAGSGGGMPMAKLAAPSDGAQLDARDVVVSEPSNQVERASAEPYYAQEQQQQEAPPYPASTASARPTFKKGGAPPRVTTSPVGAAAASGPAGGAAAGKSGSTVPGFLAPMRNFGWNFEASTADEMQEVVNFLLYSRVAQWVLALIAWACAASSVSKINESRDLAAGTVLEVFFNSSGVAWALVVALFVWFYATANGFHGFKVLGGGNTESLSALFAKVTLIGDAVFLFATLSAFSCAATQSVIFDGGVVGAAAAFCFFLWMSFLYTVPMALIIFQKAHLLQPGAPRFSRSEVDQPGAAATGAGTAESALSQV